MARHVGKSPIEDKAAEPAWSAEPAAEQTPSDMGDGAVDGAASPSDTDAGEQLTSATTGDDPGMAQLFATIRANPDALPNILVAVDEVFKSLAGPLPGTGTPQPASSVAPVSPKFKASGIDPRDARLMAFIVEQTAALTVDPRLFRTILHAALVQDGPAAATWCAERFIEFNKRSANNVRVTLDRVLRMTTVPAPGLKSMPGRPAPAPFRPQRGVKSKVL